MSFVCVGNLHGAPHTNIIRDKTKVMNETWKNFSEGKIDKLERELRESMRNHTEMSSGLPKLEYQFRGIRSGGRR